MIPDAENLERDGAGYGWHDATPGYNVSYVTPVVVEQLRRLDAKRIVDLGCGNGVMTTLLAEAGFDVVGVEPDAEGIAIARRARPDLRFHQLGVEDDPSSVGEGFDAVVSSEVVEHLFSPAMLPRFARLLLRPNGGLILTTPYHGYLKNLAMALAGNWDGHHNPLQDGAHIKFWSARTLGTLVSRQGFRVLGWRGAGRFWPVPMSMVMTAVRQDGNDLT